MPCDILGTSNICACSDQLRCRFGLCVGGGGGGGGGGVARGGGEALLSARSNFNGIFVKSFRAE